MNYSVIALLCLFSACAWSADMKPLAFVGIKSGSADYTAICDVMKKYCDKDKTTKIWKVKNKPTELYLITPSLNLVKVKSENGYYPEVQAWNFDHYAKNVEIPDEIDDLSLGTIEIFPALYPLSKTQNAIAIVTHWVASYSGGGRTENFANFIMINDDGSSMTALADVPFYQSQMIRACFSEEDYNKNAHCHDESWSILNITMQDNGAEFYSWQLINKTYEWPAFVDKAKMTVSVNKQIVYPFQNIKQIPPTNTEK